MSKTQAPSGVLIVDKPKGPTSHDVVAQVRRAFGTRKVGHAGTLDPMATGVLVVLLGEATKLSSVLTREDKSYVARVRFGIGTVAHDADSPITKKIDLPEDFLEQKGAELERALDNERVRRLQIPPAVSALKVDGRRAHALTRAGAEPDLRPRDVSVRELRGRVVSGQELEVELLVSKGYYVRALARDLGDALGVPAHLTELRRLKSGAFSIEEAVPLSEVARARLLPLVEATERSLPSLELSAAEAERVRQGKLLLVRQERLPPLSGPELVGVEGDSLVALLEPLPASEAEAARSFFGETNPETAVLRVQRGFSDHPGA